MSANRHADFYERLMDNQMGPPNGAVGQKLSIANVRFGTSKMVLHRTSEDLLIRHSSLGRLPTINVARFRLLSHRLCLGQTSKS